MTSNVALICADVVRNTMQLAREGAVDATLAKKIVYRTSKSLRHRGSSLDELSESLRDICSCCLRTVVESERVTILENSMEVPRQLVFTEDVPWGILCKQCADRLATTAVSMSLSTASITSEQATYTGAPEEFLRYALQYEDRLYKAIVVKGAEFDQLIDLGNRFRRRTDPAYYVRAISILIDECRISADIISFVSEIFLQQFPAGQHADSVKELFRNANSELSRAVVMGHQLTESRGDHTNLLKSVELLHGLVLSATTISKRINMSTWTATSKTTGIYHELLPGDVDQMNNIEDAYYQLLRDWNEDIEYLSNELEELSYLDIRSREYAGTVFIIINKIYRMCNITVDCGRELNRVSLLRELYMNPNKLGSCGSTFRDILCSLFEQDIARRVDANTVARTVGCWSAEFVASVDDFIKRIQHSGFGMTVPNCVHGWEQQLTGHNHI